MKKKTKCNHKATHAKFVYIDNTTIQEEIVCLKRYKTIYIKVKEKK